MKPCIIIPPDCRPGLNHAANRAGEAALPREVKVLPATAQVSQGWDQQFQGEKSVIKGTKIWRMKSVILRWEN